MVYILCKYQYKNSIYYIYKSIWFQCSFHSRIPNRNILDIVSLLLSLSRLYMNIYTYMCNGIQYYIIIKSVKTKVQLNMCSYPLQLCKYKVWVCGNDGDAFQDVESRWCCQKNVRQTLNGENQCKKYSSIYVHSCIIDNLPWPFLQVLWWSAQSFCVILQTKIQTTAKKTPDWVKT